MSVNDKLTKANNGVWASPATLSDSKPFAQNSVPISIATGWPVDASDGPVHFKLFKVSNEGKLVEGSASDWKGTLTGTTLSNMIKTGGPEVDYVTGDPCIIMPTAGFWNDVYDALMTSMNRDGTLKASAVLAALGINGQPPADWTVLPTSPSTSTYNGQHSHTLIFTGADYTSQIQPGTRLRTSRTVAAPTQSTSLNGSSQYWSKTSPAKLTFTDDFAVSAWVRLSAYPSTNMAIMSATDGSSGWMFYINSAGAVVLNGRNAGAGNYSRVASIQSIPLNRWVHVSAQLDMSTFAVVPTASYIMIDGVDVPAALDRQGSNPVSLVQAGTLEIGRMDSSNSYCFNGMLAQVAVFNAKVLQATMRSYMTQGLTGSEPSLASAYAFNGSATDLNTNTPNDLVANGGAVATSPTSPFGTQGNGVPSSTVDFGIAMKVTKSGSDTIVIVQTPEGSIIPALGGISGISYSSAGVPSGFPKLKTRWNILAKYKTSTATPINAGIAQLSNYQIYVPIGDWSIGHTGYYLVTAGTTVGYLTAQIGLSESLASFTSNLEDTSTSTPSMNASSSEHDGFMSRYTDYSLSAARAVYGIAKTTGNFTVYYAGAGISSTIELQNAYL